MIRLTRLNGGELYVNPDLIEIIEEIPETHLTLSNGNRYLVLEPARIVIERIISLRARVLRRGTASIGPKYLQRHQADNFRPLCLLDR